MKNLYIIALIIAIPLTGREFSPDIQQVVQKDFSQPNQIKKEKDSVFYRATEDMLATEALMIGFPLIGFKSELDQPISIAGLTSLGLLKAINLITNPEDEAINTQTGLSTATIPIAICTAGLHNAANINDKRISLSICITIYTAFVACATLKK